MGRGIAGMGVNALGNPGHSIARVLGRFSSSGLNGYRLPGPVARCPELTEKYLTDLAIEGLLLERGEDLAERYRGRLALMARKASRWIRFLHNAV